MQLFCNTAVREKERKSNAGRKGFDGVLMFKVLILQHLYNISDDETEYPIRDRYSFCRFLGVTPEGTIPDAKTIWLFRETLGPHLTDSHKYKLISHQMPDSPAPNYYR